MTRLRDRLVMFVDDLFWLTEKDPVRTWRNRLFPDRLLEWFVALHCRFSDARIDVMRRKVVEERERR